jgi:hypothetical protein
MAGYKLNITNDVMEDEEQGSKRKNQTTFNEKNYLNVKLRKNEDSKELRIRLLPIDKETGSPFKTIHMHTIAVPKEISENGWKSYVCLKHTDDIDHDAYGNDCPFCEMNHIAFEKMKKAVAVGNEVLVKYEATSREWQGKWFTSCQCFYCSNVVVSNRRNLLHKHHNSKHLRHSNKKKATTFPFDVERLIKMFDLVEVL